MITQMKWIDRKFNFDFPLDIYPSLLERLRFTPMRVEQLVTGLDEATITAKPNGKWSIKEQVGHLATVERLWDKRLNQFLAGEKELIGADMTNQPTEKENFNDWEIDKLVELFKKVRSDFMFRLDNLSENEIGITALHPRLQKPMRLIDMVYFVAEHDDQELALMRAKL